MASRRVVPKRKYKTTKPKKPFVPYVESMVLKQEYQQILKQVQVLTKRRQYIKQILKERGDTPIKRSAYFDKPIFLYAVRCEGGYFYIGTTRNLGNRLTRHKKGKGSMWTAEHKPIDYIETRNTGSNDDSKAGLLEDDMTIEYAMKYGSNYVRGGGYCQRKPHWPALIIQNEKHS